MTLLVSVIIPVYNQELYLAETIESVLGQTYRNFELILIDDGSVDNSAEIIAQYASKDNRIVAIHIPNGGKAKAINKAAKLAKGALLAFMDHDDCMMPYRLEKQVAYLDSHSEVSAVNCNCQYIDENGTDLGVQRYNQLSSPEESKTAMQQKKHIMCAFTALTVRKLAFDKIGGLRSRYWPSDDIDFINRLPQNGFLLVILNETLVKYRIHSGSTTSSQQWQLFRMADYTNHCIGQRNSELEEPTLTQFMAMRKKDGWWVNMQRKAHNHSILYLQKANFQLKLKNYLKFLIYFAKASILDSKYVVSNARKRFKVMSK